MRPHLLLLALALLLAACQATSSTSATAGLEPGEDGWRGSPLDGERTMPEVTLTDTDGEPFDLAADTQGTPTLLFFGYTHCPDVCPVHLAAIASAMDEAGVSTDEIDMVFVTVDPDRDDRARLEEWVKGFDDGFTGLRTDEETVEATLETLDLPGPQMTGEDPRGDGDDELIAHPAQVYGFDADGVARRAWPFGTRRADWIADLPRFVEEAA